MTPISQTDEDLEAFFGIVPNLRPRSGSKPLARDQQTCDPEAFDLEWRPKPPPPIVECLAPTVPMTSDHLMTYNPMGQDSSEDLVMRIKIIRRLLGNGPFTFVGLHDQPFTCDGVYALYYHGPLQIYEPLKSLGSTLPIYIGKSSQYGVPTPGSTRNLHTRLIEHYKSIEQTGLGLHNFTFRFIHMPTGWIELAEVTLITAFRPLWNNCLKGFGTRSSGKESMNRTQITSAWDTWHPGRMVAGPHTTRSLETIEMEIRDGLILCLRSYNEIMQLLRDAPSRDLVMGRHLDNSCLI